MWELWEHLLLAGHSCWQVCAAFARALGLVALFPMGEGVFSIARKTATSILLSIWLMHTDKVISSQAEENAFKIILELFQGFSLSLSIYISILCFELWGELFDFARGQTIAQAYSSEFDTHASPSALLAKHFGLLCVLFAGGFDSVLKRFISLPIGEVAVSFLQCLHFSLHSLGLVLLCFLPLAWAFLLCDLFLGIISRMIPSLSLASEGFLLKAALGYGMLILGLKANLLPLTI